MNENNATTMQGKVCMVTGANTGMGYVTALALARMGATVMLVCRDRERGEQAQQRMKAESGNPNIELLIADLSSMASVRNLAEEFKQRHSHLHVLINNAGVITSQRIETVDGFEQMFAVNHLAPFLLTNLLLDTMMASASARIINITSSATRLGARISFDNLQGTKRFSSFSLYAQSKLASLLFTYELARLLQGTGVTVNAADPGGVKTGMTAPDPAASRFSRFLASLNYRFMSSPEQGAATAIYLASAPEVAAVTGSYFLKKKPIRSSKASYDTSLARAIWHLSAQLTKLKVNARARAGNALAGSHRHP